MKVAVFNATRRRRLPKKKLARAVQYVIASERKEFDVNIVLVGPGKMQALNREFRKRDVPTDVLSFLPEETEEPPPFIPTGEIYLCPEIAVRQARAHGQALQTELLHLAVHGALHLCGYVHDTPAEFEQMQRRTQRYLERRL